MKIHKEGLAIIITVIIVFLFLYIIVAQIALIGTVLCNIVGVIGLVLLSFALFFFRNPRRKVKTDQSVIYAPADGKIIAVEEVDEAEYLKRKCIKVSIFMSVWNVHVNRYPVSGKVCYTKYHPGKYLIANHPKSSELNEHQTVVIEKTGGIEVMVKQIAGIVARRVVCYAKTGEKVIQGEDLGFIKFGSRVDLFLPSNIKILVRLNKKVKGNKTLIARFNN